MPENEENVDSFGLIEQLEFDAKELNSLIIDSHTSILESYFEKYDQAKFLNNEFLLDLFVLCFIDQKKQYFGACLNFLYKKVPDLDPQLRLLIEDFIGDNLTIEAVLNNIVGTNTVLRSKAGAKLLTHFYDAGIIDWTEQNAKVVSDILHQFHLNSDAAAFDSRMRRNFPESLVFLQRVKDFNRKQSGVLKDISQTVGEQRRFQKISDGDPLLEQLTAESRLYTSNGLPPGKFKVDYAEIYEGKRPANSTLLWGDDNSERAVSTLTFRDRSGPNNVWRLEVSDLDPKGGHLSVGLFSKIVELAETSLLAADGGILEVLSASTDDLASENAIFLSEQGFRPSISYHMLINLLSEERLLYSNIRKSYKNLINRSQKQNLTLVFNRVNSEFLLGGKLYNKNNISDILNYLNNMSGRMYFKRGIFNLLADWILTKHGGEILIEVHPEWGPVGGLITLDYGNRTYYAWSRSFGPTADLLSPSAHRLLWDAIINAKRRNRSEFILGELETQSIPGSKLKGISFFKRGFMTHYGHSITWAKLL